MIRLPAFLLPLALLLLPALLPAPAAAASVRADRGAELDWRIPAGHVLSAFPLAPLRALPRVRLVTAEVVILPSGRMITRTLAAIPAPPAPPPRTDLIALPLPGAMPLLLAAIGGLVLAGRRRRPRIAGARPPA